MGLEELVRCNFLTAEHFCTPTSLVAWQPHFLFFSHPKPQIVCFIAVCLQVKQMTCKVLFSEL